MKPDQHENIRKKNMKTKTILKKLKINPED
jgi:hypothetical protein